jgi:hypothetical protein
VDGSIKTLLLLLVSEARRLGAKVRSVSHAIEGSGKEKLARSITNVSYGGYSPDVQAAYDKAILLGIAKVGKVLADEILDGQNLLASYGYGAELALFTGVRFEFVPKLSYILWEVTLEPDGSISDPALHTRMATYENKSKYALLSVIQTDGSKSSAKAENTYVALLTPLHDDMPHLTPEPIRSRLASGSSTAPWEMGYPQGYEADITSKYYFVYIRVHERLTGAAHAVCFSFMASDDLKLFRVTKRGDGQFYFELNMKEIESMLRPAFPNATWRGPKGSL